MYLSIFLFAAAFGIVLCEQIHTKAPNGCAGGECYCSSDERTHRAYVATMYHFDKQCAEFKWHNVSVSYLDIYIEGCQFREASKRKVRQGKIDSVMSNTHFQLYNNCSATNEFTNRLLCLLTSMSIDYYWAEKHAPTLFEKHLRSICTYRYHSAQCIVARMKKETPDNLIGCTIQEL